MTPDEMKARLIEQDEEMLELRLQNAAMLKITNTCYRILRELEDDYSEFRGVRCPPGLEPYETRLGDALLITTWFISTIHGLEKVLKDVDVGRVTEAWSAELRK